MTARELSRVRLALESLNYERESWKWVGGEKWMYGMEVARLSN